MYYILLLISLQKKVLSKSICTPTFIDFSSKTTKFSDYLNIDYNTDNLSYKNGVASLQLTKNKGGTRISLKDQLHYGKVDVKMKIAKGSNVVSSFILLAKNGDEIDFEFVQNSTKNTGTLLKNVGDDRGTDLIQTNYFYRGIPIYDKNAQMFNTKKILSDNFHTYSLKWDPSYYEWYFDNRLLRRLYKNSTKNYPDTISNIQFGIWEAQPSSWAGSGINWNDSPFNFDISSIKVECLYNKNNNTNTNNSTKTKTNYSTKQPVQTSTVMPTSTFSLSTSIPTLTNTNSAYNTNVMKYILFLNLLILLI
jgi:beta-glucanase (GH16 family)